MNKPHTNPIRGTRWALIALEAYLGFGSEMMLRHIERAAKQKPVPSGNIRFSKNPPLHDSDRFVQRGKCIYSSTHCLRRKRKKDLRVIRKSFVL